MGPQFTVIPYDITGNRIFGLDKALITRGGDPFGLQAPEEPFHRAIIPTVTASTHTLLNLITPQRLAVFTAGIVASLITMEHDTCRTATQLPRHL